MKSRHFSISADMRNKMSRLAVGGLIAVALLITPVFISIGTTTSSTAIAAVSPCPYPLIDANRPVAPAAAANEVATFTDPTAEISSKDFVRVSHNVYIAPFARLEAQSSEHGICIEEASNVQDNTLVKVNGGPIHLGAHAIMAHGSELVGDGTEVTLGHYPKPKATDTGFAGFDASCTIQPPPHRSRSLRRVLSPDDLSFATAEARGRQALGIALVEFASMPGGERFKCGEVPAFISFNALNQSQIEDGALLSATSRLTRGVSLRAGYTSWPGKSLNTQLEADTPGDFSTGQKVRYVTAGDIAFMTNVVHVNECLAKGYTMQYRDTARAIHPFGGPESINGIGIDPGSYHRCEFNHDSERPTIGYPPDADLSVRDINLAVANPNPVKKIRLIGDVRMVDIDKIQDKVSIRADEGEPFTFRGGIEFGFANTFHALEIGEEDTNREIRIGPGVKFEERVIVHGGGRRQRVGSPGEETSRIGELSYIGKESVVFRSDIEPRTQVGAKAVLAGYTNCTNPRGEVADPNAPCHPPGYQGTPEVIPDRCVKFQDGNPRGTCAYFVEW